MADDAWMETCLVAITKINGDDVNYQSLTETVDIDLGEKDIEQIHLLNGGRVTKFTPESETTITLEAYPLEAGTDDGTTGKGFFDLLHTQDTEQPIVIRNTRTRNKYRIALLWTDWSTATCAAAAINTSTGYKAMRVVAANGYITSVKPSFTDGILKFTITFKCAAFDKAGQGNILLESCDGSNTASLLTALQSYTDSTNW